MALCENLRVTGTSSGLPVFGKSTDVAASVQLPSPEQGRSWFAGHPTTVTCVRNLLRLKYVFASRVFNQ
jgi:hypothetical protein